MQQPPLENAAALQEALRRGGRLSMLQPTPQEEALAQDRLTLAMEGWTEALSSVEEAAARQQQPLGWEASPRPVEGLRRDQVEASLPRQAVLQNTPATKDGFVVLPGGME